jgi:hypothetical protein
MLGRCLLKTVTFYLLLPLAAMSNWQQIRHRQNESYLKVSPKEYDFMPIVHIKLKDPMFCSNPHYQSISGMLVKVLPE